VAFSLPIKKSVAIPIIFCILEKKQTMKSLLCLLTLTTVLFASCTNLQNTDPMPKALLVTGNDHPAHEWQKTTPVVKEILESDSTAEVVVTEDPNQLAEVSTGSYDLIILNYCNWKDPSGITEEAKKGFVEFLENGGGLIILHFSNGAFHSSLPEAGESDWPEYRNIVHQVWDHDKGSVHDPYGVFKVEMTDEEHFITKGISDFETEDELYYNQIGEEELPPLFTAVSKESGEPEPLAWAYTYKNARVFQTLLGHGPESYEPEPYREILRRAVFWVTNSERKE
jgi:type 1 glutamine amidotransferase